MTAILDTVQYFKNFQTRSRKEDLFQASSVKETEVPVQWELLKRIRLHHCTPNRCVRQQTNFILLCKEFQVLIPFLYIIIFTCNFLLLSCDDTLHHQTIC